MNGIASGSSAAVSRADASIPGSVDCVPVPTWVDHIPYQAQTPADDCKANGVCRLLHEVQVDLSGPEQACHWRCAQLVLTRAGAERAAHFVAEFDPAYQRLEVHFIRVLRGPDCIEHAKLAAIQTFRRETNLERLVFDGRLTASLLIPDVRVDDIVEVAFTVYGSNPVLGRKFAASMGFDAANPWLESRFRLLRPAAREVFMKSFNDPPPAEDTVEDNLRDMRWRIVGQQRREGEALTPPWLMLSPAVQFSEFERWDHVARLFAPLYATSVVPATLAEEIDRLAAAHADPAARAAEWLRFVQRVLRYFALSLGEGGLLPRAIEAIWTSRLGDCKDAALLYVAGARRLGLDACPALVSTTHGPVLNDFLASPVLFNHCIVRLRLNGAEYWFDPTIRTQSGSLGNIFQPHVGWALPLAPETMELEKIGSEVPVHVMHVEEELSIGPRRGSPAKLRRHVAYSSWVADTMRNRIADAGAAEYANGTLKQLRATWPGIAEVAPMETCDDSQNNRFDVTLSYELRDGWKQVQAGTRLSINIVDMTTANELAPLAGVNRSTDIYLGRPRKITRRIRVNMPRRWIGVGWFIYHKSPGIDYTDELKTNGRVVTSSKELVIDASSVPADQAGAYIEAVGKLRQNVLSLGARERFGRIRPSGADLTLGGIVWWMYVMVMIGTLIFGVLHSGVVPVSRPAYLPTSVSPRFPATLPWPVPTGPVPQWPPAPAELSR